MHGSPTHARPKPGTSPHAPSALVAAVFLHLTLSFARCGAWWIVRFSSSQSSVMLSSHLFLGLPLGRHPCRRQPLPSQHSHQVSSKSDLAWLRRPDIILKVIVCQLDGCLTMARDVQNRFFNLGSVSVRFFFKLGFGSDIIVTYYSCNSKYYSVSGWHDLNVTDVIHNNDNK